MKVMAWNIRDGGMTRFRNFNNPRQRLDQVLASVRGHGPDVLVLTEFRSGPGEAIVGELESRGWRWSAKTETKGAVNGICVLSRSAMSVRRRESPVFPQPERWLELEFPEHRLAIAATHIPCTSPSKPGSREVKRAFWQAVLQAADQLRDEPSMIIGDYNTGIPRVDEPERTFDCVEEFKQLGRSGWTDAWRHFHGDSREFTWCMKNCFRIDHAFVSEPLLGRLRDCRYSHAEREADYSDHSIVIVELG